MNLNRLILEWKLLSLKKQRSTVWLLWLFSTNNNSNWPSVTNEWKRKAWDATIVISFWIELQRMRWNQSDVCCEFWVPTKSSTPQSHRFISQYNKEMVHTSSYCIQYIMQKTLLRIYNLCEDICLLTIKSAVKLQRAKLKSEKEKLFCDHEVWTQVSKQSHRMSTIRFWWWQSTSCLYLGQRWLLRKIEGQPLQSEFVVFKQFENSSKSSNLQWFYTFFCSRSKGQIQKGLNHLYARSVRRSCLFETWQWSVRLKNTLPCVKVRFTCRKWLRVGSLQSNSKKN